MAENRTLNTRLRLKYDTAANWATKNPVLLAGEVGIESDTLLGKVGDGEKTWQQLEYLNANYAKRVPGYFAALILSEGEDVLNITYNGEETRGLGFNGDDFAGSWPTNEATGEPETDCLRIALKQSIKDILNGALRFDVAQSLTEDQKKQVRSNIGAGTSNLTLAGNGSATTAAKSDHTHNYAGSSSAGGAATSANKVNAALTFNNSGNGAASGTTFDGSTARTISYNTIGAAASSHNHDDKYLTGIKMNGASKGTSGVVDLGTVLTDASKFATAAQGTKADNAMPKSGGTFTGEVKFGSTENFQGYYIKRMLGSLGPGTRYADLDSKYKDGTWHRMWRLRFPSGSNFWGKIKITLYGGYSSFNASGVMSKSITCNFNTSNIYNNVGCYDGLGVNVEQDFRISEAIWNSTASAWEVLIWQKNLNGNNSPVIMLECWTTNNTNYINAFNGIAAQTVELTQSTSYSAQRASSTGGTKTVEWATLPVYENPLGEEIATVAMLKDKQDKITSSNKLSASLVSDLAKVATSGSYNDLLNKPTKLSDFTDDKVIKFTNTTVAASAFVADNNYSNYGYCASISLSGVTANDTADVYFSGEQVEQEIYASFCESYAGGVKIYAAEKPSEAVIIPLILIHK